MHTHSRYYFRAIPMNCFAAHHNSYLLLFQSFFQYCILTSNMKLQLNLRLIIQLSKIYFLCLFVFFLSGIKTEDYYIMFSYSFKSVITLMQLLNSRSNFSPFSVLFFKNSIPSAFLADNALLF